MKKFCALILALLAIFALTACGEDLPDGMQLVFGGEDAGYYFYAPEEWTVSNVGDIKSAYASRLDTTSMSFAEVKPTLPADSELSLEEYFFTEYFADSLTEFTIAPTVTLNGERTEFGKENETADRAVRYAYNCEYSGHKFGFMQILIKEGERYFIFTYSALLEIKSEEKTYYDYYSEKLASVIKCFRFTGEGKPVEDSELSKDEDGYTLISDASLSGFDAYVPETFTKDYASAIVSATHGDGTNVSLTKAVSTGVVVSDYWKMRKDELSKIVGEITVIRENEPTKLGNSSQAFAYEYTFVYNGEVYHVYQVLAVAGSFLMPNGYVFTLTAHENNYNTHLSEMQSMIEKVNFR